LNAGMLRIKSIFIRNVLRPTNLMRFTTVFPGPRANAGLVPKIHCYTAYFSCVPPTINFKISAQMQHSKHIIQPRCSAFFLCCMLQKHIAPTLYLPIGLSSTETSANNRRTFKALNLYSLPPY